MKILIAIIISLSATGASAADEGQTPPLKIEEVRCRGNLLTRCSFIKGQVFLSPGDPLNEEEVRHAKIRLSALSNFKSTDISLEKGSERGLVVLVIEVEEASPLLTEFRTGTSLILQKISQRTGARVAHQNLFGLGKILELNVDGRISLTGDKWNSLYTRLQYVDPHFFDSKKNFLVTGITYSDSEYLHSDEFYYESQRLGANVLVGRRIFDFSYITLGYEYNHRARTLEWSRDYFDDLHEKRDSYTHAYSLGFGWNTEDDPYFPTNGSRFAMDISVAEPDSTYSSTYFRSRMAYRQNWTTSNGSTWSLKVGGTPSSEFRTDFEDDQGVAISYSRPIDSTLDFGAIKRGRWYVEPGIGPLGYTSASGFLFTPGIKVGIRLESETLGIIDLYALGIADWSSK